jgi:hypothetical protein
MRRLVLACAAVMAVATAASAQPTATPAANVVAAGGSTALSIQGTAGHQYAVIGSSTNAGFSYAGVALSVGTDVAILGVGALDGAGQASFTLTPPFPARDRFYVQVVTTADGFASIAASNSVVLLNNQEARLYMPVGGLVNSAGTTIFATPGVTVGLAGNVFTINHAGLFQFNNPIPLVTPTGGATVQSISTSASQTVVTLSGAGGIAFTIEQVRR